MPLARWERGLDDVSQHPAILAALRSSSRFRHRVPALGWCTCSIMARPLTCGCSGAPPTWLIWATGTPAAVSRLVWCALGLFGEGRVEGGDQAGAVANVAGAGGVAGIHPSRVGQGPAASAKARPRPSLPAAAMMWPSAAAKASQGTIVGRAEPYRSGVRPVAYQPGGEAGQPGTSARRAGRRPPGRARPGLPQLEDVPARKRGRRTRQRDPWPPGISRMLRSRLTSGAPGTGPNAEQSEPGPAVPASADRTRRAGRPCAPARTLPPGEVSDSHLSSMIVAGCAVHASAWPTTAGTSASP
jgi:hypothetical protein